MTRRWRLQGRWGAAQVLERLPLILMGDGSPLIGATAAVVGLISAWPADHHPPLLVRYGGHLELYAWVLCLLGGAAAIFYGLLTRQWRAQVAGLMLAGTGLFVYGLAFALTYPGDSAAVGVPPMVLGVAAAVRILIVSALGVTWEARQPQRGVKGGARD
jgi:hypothetical protein